MARVLRLNRSTTHTMWAASVEHNYVIFVPRSGYGLSAKLPQLSYEAQGDISLIRTTHEHLVALTAGMGTTDRMRILDGTRALYLDKGPGRRRTAISPWIGDRQLLCSAWNGKSLILGGSEGRCRELSEVENLAGHRCDALLNVWPKRMRKYAKLEYTFELEENENRICCTANPIRDATSAIATAVCVSGPHTIWPTNVCLVSLSRSGIPWIRLAKTFVETRRASQYASRLAECKEVERT